jgi:O-antigen/teichoic acid export membrane protein
MLGKNLATTVLTQIPLFILSVLTGIFSTRFLGDDAKGIYSIFQANTQLFVLIFSLGIQTGIVYFISSKKILEEKILGISLIIIIISSLLLLSFLVILKVSNLLFYITSAEYDSFLYVVLLFVMFLFTLVSSILTSFFQAYSKFRIINQINILNSIINCCLFLILYITFQKNNLSQIHKLNYTLYCTTLSLFINSILWFYIFKKEFNIRPDSNFKLKNEFKTFISYSFIIFLGTLINFFNYRIDLWIVNFFCSNKQLSYYSLATNISQIIIYISVTIGSVILPFLSSKSIEERKILFPKISRFSFTLFFIIVIIAFILSEHIIPLVYGKVFYDSIKPFKILLIGVLFSCLTQLIATLVVASEKNMLNIIATSIGLLFTILLDFLLIPIYNIEGAAWATTISYLVIFIITFFLFLKKLNYPIKNYFVMDKRDLKALTYYLKK